MSLYNALGRLNLPRALYVVIYKMRAPHKVYGMKTKLGLHTGLSM